MTRLFIAGRPPPEVVRTVSAFQRPEIDGVRWSVPEQWMVTIRPLGHVDLSLAGMPISARWTVRSVCLVADRSAPGAPRHENLAAIALEPPDA